MPSGRADPLGGAGDPGALEPPVGDEVLHDPTHDQDHGGDAEDRPRRGAADLPGPDQDRGRGPGPSRAGSAPGCRPARPRSPGRPGPRRRTRSRPFHTAERPRIRGIRGLRSRGVWGQPSASGADWPGGVGQLVGLVDERDGDLLELVTVLAGVVGAEQELAPGLELHAKVGLGAAPVAAVRCGQRRAGCKCSVTSASFLFSGARGCNVRSGSPKIPRRRLPLTSQSRPRTGVYHTHVAPNPGPVCRPG